ncbi:D-alanyl-D-alanine carboxypeptidase [Clostridium estertheticum]|uniref:serine-type D-Ala-D-Ala carboxypeptidase n=1 Tax=Clostridium estertheticum TaxID=238834 RepID=A0AA47EF83_9CLOT|nr:D-alanyl-D-alanine carboxypeptidase family protein [Clostridium estertheticum]WAG59113.1 D-alanyl-D-alanine carboxypeptidase [Clostridium estertheticum]WAG66835.1 D-alanyl-D-alanine carboxypeptidase [Clostridium estertheticum]
MKNKRFFILIVLFLVSSMSLNVFAATGSESTTNVPTIYGKAAITVDVATGEIIYAKDVDKQMYPASMTKLITALLLAENRVKTDKIKYTQSAKIQPADSLNVNLHSIGLNETMSSADVMDGLLLFSANDTAYMIADNISGNSTNFMKMMNDKAAKLQMTKTHFVTPNGLHDPDHYTTPYDMSILARFAFLNPWVKESMNKKQSTLSTSKGTTFKIENSNKLLGVNGCIGGKTGYTSKAGRCLVAFYERNGREIMGVVMGSVMDASDTYVFNDMEKIINYSYTLQRTVLHANNSVVKTETLKYKPLKFFGPEKTVSVPLVVKEDVSYYKNDANEKDLKENINLSDITVSSLKGNESIGTLRLTQKGKVKTYKLYSAVSSGALTKNDMPIYLMAAGILALVLVGIALIIRTNYLKKRKRRRKIKY